MADIAKLEAELWGRISGKADVGIEADDKRNLSWHRAEQCAIIATAGS